MDATTNHMNPYQIGIIDRFSCDFVLSGLISELTLMMDYFVLPKQQNICYKDYEKTQNGKSNSHCGKSVRIRTFSGPHFSSFRLNTESHRVSLCIHFKCGPEKLRIQTLFTQCQWAKTLNKNRKVAGSKPTGWSTMLSL